MAATERLAREVLRALSDSELNLILLPTEKCNFRCTYCYEVFAIGRMSPDVIRGVKLLIGGRLPTLRWLSIDWFGGEPLLARNVIEDICGYVCGAVRDTEVTYTSGV